MPVSLTAEELATTENSLPLRTPLDDLNQLLRETDLPSPLNWMKQRAMYSSQHVRKSTPGTVYQWSDSITPLDAGIRSTMESKPCQTVIDEGTFVSVLSSFKWPHWWLYTD